MRLELSQLQKSYGSTRAIEDLTLTLPDEVRALALIGPSGGGKSTLLRLIGGLEIPDSGSVKLGGRPVGTSPAELLARRRKNGYLFQSFNLFPHLDALRNVSLPLEKVHGASAADSKKRAIECLERFGMADHAGKRPAELSGGQQQRVGLARAIAHQPELLILDEPTSALDPEMTSEVLDLIAQLQDEGQSIILSTHEIGFAKEVADYVAFLADGRVAECGPSKGVFAQPESAALAQFLAKVTRFA